MHAVTPSNPSPIILLDNQSYSTFHLWQDNQSQDIQINVEGNNCRVEIFNLVFGNTGGEVNLNQKIIISGNNAVVNHLTRIVAESGSSISISKLVNIPLGNTGTTVNQKIQVVYLESDSDTDNKPFLNLNPVLEIASPEAVVSHGVSVGALSALEIKYLNTRGLDDIESKRVLVRDFVSDFVKNIQPECARLESLERFLGNLEG